MPGFGGSSLNYRISSSEMSLIKGSIVSQKEGRLSAALLLSMNIVVASAHAAMSASEAA
jgi:hypothetical protein